MASVLSYRPSTNGTVASAGSNPTRQASLSSFPSWTRTPSNASVNNGIPTATIARSVRQPSVSRSRTPSSTPSTKLLPQFAGQARRAGITKSQYPADSIERHVEYILVASFDIDRGSVMEHQYPGAISGDENKLAELMLPDQAHVRNQDWTIFFLHKGTNGEAETEASANEEVQAREAEKKADGQTARTDKELDTPESTGEVEIRKKTGAPEEAELEGGEGPPLIYVLNLVNTKQDTSAKRFCALNRLLSLLRC